jgi:hypothetical protein
MEVIRHEAMPTLQDNCRHLEQGYREEALLSCSMVL